MNIGVFDHGWWQTACQSLGHDYVSLPVSQHASGNVYAADLATRIATSDAVATKLQNSQPVDYLLDNGGTGLLFRTDDGSTPTLTPFHETQDKILVSHFIDPLVTAFQGLGWEEVWQSLGSASWVKAVWDLAQVAELQRFGVPSVVHLPMAAPDRTYNTAPLDGDAQKPIASFIGAQNTSYFKPNQIAPTNSLLAGVLAHALRSDLPNAIFFDAYFDIYGLDTLPTANDTAQIWVNKVLSYFNAKLFYNAQMCLRNRDRFVIFLKRKLGDSFFVAGRGWDEAYGLSTHKPFDSVDDYFNHFREVAININLVNGNAETGLNMRHYEITAAGGFMLCYEQPELASHFEVGKECVSFNSEQDLLDKIQYYIQHPNERTAIALAGQRRTLSRHLHSHRLATLLDMLNPKPLPVEYSQTNFNDDIKSLLPNANVILDCGANVGQMAESFRNLYPNAKIFSFEPVTSVFKKLAAKCNAIGVEPIKAAVGDHDGKDWINLTSSDEANSMLGFEPGNPCERWTKVVGREEIDVCTLDRWCETNNIKPAQVDLVKLDIQGGEIKALQGAEKLLKEASAVYLEVSFVPMYKESPLFADVEDFLTQRGYRRHAIYPSDQPHNWGDALYVKI